jgi:hypothetical protein
MVAVHRWIVREISSLRSHAHVKCGLPEPASTGG